MLTRSLIVARKEIVDHVRDARSMASSALYALMGPAVVCLALFARQDAAAAPGQAWPVMAAVFALMAVFTGAMGPAMDMLAGERERRTLLPLIVTSTSRREVIVGKWIAASAFAAGGLVINLAGFGLVFAASSRPPAALSWLLAAPALFSLAFLAGALVILVSTFCRSTKEANTYLSILIFSIMGIAMWLAFRPEVSPHWLNVMPLTGHQHLLKQAFTGPASSTVHVVLVGAESLLLFVSTAASAALVLAGSWTIFEREEAVYGG